MAKGSVRVCGGGKGRDDETRYTAAATKEWGGVTGHNARKIRKGCVHQRCRHQHMPAHPLPKKGEARRSTRGAQKGTPLGRASTGGHTTTHKHTYRHAYTHAQAHTYEGDEKKGVGHGESGLQKVDQRQPKKHQETEEGNRPLREGGRQGRFQSGRGGGQRTAIDSAERAS